VRPNPVGHDQMLHNMLVFVSLSWGVWVPVKNKENERKKYGEFIIEEI